MVESQPSKLLVAGSIPVSRSRKVVKSNEWQVTSGKQEEPNNARLIVTLHFSLVSALEGPM